MGRISIPNIPLSSHTIPSRTWSVAEAAEHISRRLERNAGSSLIMTGAGVSVDAGIAPYRGEGGHYTVHKDYRPIFFQEFMDSDFFRKRYYARSYLGYPPVRAALPNVTHTSIAAIQRLGHVPQLITQNVDSLHQAATPSASLAAESIVELHGSLANVVCVSSPSGHKAQSQPIDPASHDALSVHRLSSSRSVSPRAQNTLTASAYPLGCGFQGSRSAFQDALTDLNPRWHALSLEMARDGTKPRSNPDGDVELDTETDYTTFKYPNCPNCGGVLKPSVTFFGESIPNLVRDTAHNLVAQSSFLLLIGSSLATYSAFRLVKQAQAAGLEIVILNIGPTRADNLVPDKMELGSSEVMKEVALLLAGSRANNDPVLARLLTSGVLIKPQQTVVSS